MLESINILNEYQKDAVLNNDRFLLLNASVGSGKTTVLVQKILYLYQVKKVPVKDMVVLTFTNKAAEEIKERVLSIDSSGIEKKDLTLFGTFHSTARYLLSNVLPVEDLGYTRDFTIIDGNGMQELFESIIDKYNFDIKYIKKLEKRMGLYKEGKAFYGNMKREDDIEKFMDILKEEKIKRNVMDFDDLIDNAVQLLKEGYFKASWVIVDEFQDTNKPQLCMIDGFIGEDTHVFAVGDPNQTIYSWRGSSRDIFSTFKERHHAAEKSLPVNYRSTGTIIGAAKALLDNPQSLEGIRETGAPVVIKRHYNGFNEAVYLVDKIRKLNKDGVPLKDIAIFYRKQKQSSVFEDVFKREGIPYDISVKKAVKDIPALYWFMRLLKASVNNNDSGSLLHVLTDSRYGLNLTKREAKKIADMISGEADSNPPELIGKIKGFKNWCKDTEGLQEIEDKIYEYFDIDSYLSPTSIYFNDDKDIIKKYINEIKEFSAAGNHSVFEGVRGYVDYSTLYGTGIINELIDCEEDSVKLMTIHASKGLEFKYVFISGANSGIIPIGGRYDDEEEKRLFFVGITRAKDYLEISYHSNPDDYNALPMPSPYLSLIPDELIESEELKSRSHKLSELRKEIKSNIENKKEEQAEQEEIKRSVTHPKYGAGYIISENDELYLVHFHGYGDKSFAKAFCPLIFNNN